MNAEYTRAHRAFEITSIALYGALLVCLLLEASWAPHMVGWGYLWAALSLAFGLVSADFVSGLVHWLADGFGRKDWPFLGSGFIRPFREHHDDPGEMARHDFIEVNGNSAVCILLFLPFVGVARWVLPDALAGWLSLATVGFTITILFTNQIHAWAHMDEVPRVIRFLQKHRVILNVDDHNLHHTPPHLSYFCISYGWCNPILEKTRFFERIYWIACIFLPEAKYDDSDGPITELS